MEIKKIVKFDGKLKGVHIVDGNLVDLDGEIIDLISILSKVYGENYFDLSTTNKKEEILDLDQVEEAHFDEDGNLVYGDEE